MKNSLKLYAPVFFIIMTSVFCLGPLTSFAQNKPIVKNIVIVHGAFADASGWEAVYKMLKEDGYNVTAVQNLPDKNR